MPVAFALLLAQAVPDTISGGGGWAGAGLLGGVLVWLLFWHLPAKDKQINDLIEKKDNQLDEQRKEFVRSLADMMASFKAESAAERAACERHFETLATTMNTSLKTLGDQLSAHGERNRQWIELLKREIEVKGGVVPPQPPPYKSPDGVTP